MTGLPIFNSSAKANGPNVSKIRIDLLDTGDCQLTESCVQLVAKVFLDARRYSPERIRNELSTQDPHYYRQFFVAMAAGEVIGVGGVKAADWASDTHLLYLSAVRIDRRGEGIGRALIKARIAWVKANFPSGRLLVSTAKPKRYKSWGFRELTKSRLADGRRLMMQMF